MALWKPSAERIAESNLQKFASGVEAKYNVRIKNSDELYQFSIAQPEKFWQAVWDYNSLPFIKGTKTISNKNDMFKAKFFEDSKVNYAEALLKRKDDETAIYFKCENQPTKKVSWKSLYQQTASFAKALKKLGVEKGDRVAAYMPNMPETIVAFLATASIGAIWTSCSPDFGVAGVLDRFGQTKPKILIASDGYYYNGKSFAIKEKVKELCQNIDSIEASFIVPFLQEKADTGFINNAHDFSLAINEDCQIEFKKVAFNDPLYILYSSGTTGKPKCIVHATGGVILKHLSEHQLQCDIKGNDALFFFTTCGWMMWNWLITALASQASIVLYDGSPLYPDANVLWDYAEEIGITHFGVSPKYLDAIQNQGITPSKTHRLEKLRSLLTAGSPLLPEQFDYVYQSIKQDLHLGSISGGTDIVGLFVGGDPTKPVHRGEIQAASFGIATEVFDENAKPLQVGRGELVCTAPFPSQPVEFWNDDKGEKYFNAYFNHFENVWHHGDFIELTENGGYIIHGRSDATLNPGGVRIGTAEIYAQTEALPEIIEAIVVGQEWQGDSRIVLFVRLQEGASLNESLKNTIKQNIKKNCSPRHVPAKIIQVSDIPRTRSGKITELAVRNIIHNKPVTNQTALINPEALKLFENIQELET